MKAQAALNHFQEIGRWVDWGDTGDQFLHGDPQVDVSGIAVSWLATNTAIQQAADNGLNLFICHEAAFYEPYEETPIVDSLVSKKKKLLGKNNITLLRCHDTWDRMPEIGIVDSWTRFLGFPTPGRPVESFYTACQLDNVSVEDTAANILRKLKPLGQDAVSILGDKQKRINRLAVGTGAITNFPEMYKLNVDAILATDDGFFFTSGGHWALDMTIPLIIVNHATAEIPGMRALTDYLQGTFPALPVQYLDCGLPHRLATVVF